MHGIFTGDHCFKEMIGRGHVTAFFLWNHVIF